MFIIATHSKYKDHLQQFWGSNLVAVISEAKWFGDPENKISVYKDGSNIDIRFRDGHGIAKTESFAIGEDGYLGRIGVFLSEIVGAVNGGYKNEYLIFDTSNPEHGYKGSGGKVEVKKVPKGEKIPKK